MLRAATSFIVVVVFGVLGYLSCDTIDAAIAKGDRELAERCLFTTLAIFIGWCVAIFRFFRLIAVEAETTL